MSNKPKQEPSAATGGFEAPHGCTGTRIGAEVDATRLVAAMCNRYHPTRAEIIRAQWDLGEPATGDRTWRPGIGPWGQGPFIRMRSGSPELVVGTWALIGDDYRQPVNRARSTNNARWETIGPAAGCTNEATTTLTRAGWHVVSFHGVVSQALRSSQHAY